jgi:hypothetical protein
MVFKVDREAVFNKVKALPPNIVAIECEWDGDNEGWHVRLIAIEEVSADKFTEHLLTIIGHGLGEIYDFNRALVGATPPYPEGHLAREIGQEVAASLGIPFYFASPDKPALAEVLRWVDWRVGRASSIPIRLLDPQPVIEQYSNKRVAVVEAYWGYYHKFFPKFCVVTIEQSNANQHEYKANQIGELYWDNEDIGRTIYGQEIPPRTPVEEAIRIGNHLSEQLTIPFFFAFPDKPSHHIPRWITLQKE